MPTWDRQCNACDELFTVSCKYENKEDTKECPYCGSTDGSYMLSAPVSSIRPERFMTHRPDKGFGEVLDKIKERNPRSNLASGRNTGERAMQ